jgi:cytoskeletal protein CcmA (bactofilin family)
MIITETGSLRGALEAVTVEINGHVEGKITADSVIIGRSAVIKGDIFFKNTLKTEEGADIDGYIKRINNGKSNTEEDIAIEEIVERVETIKPKTVHVGQTHKEAV